MKDEDDDDDDITRYPEWTSLPTVYLPPDNKVSAITVKVDLPKNLGSSLIHF